ncbi:integrase [Bradyrhizobium jicamae]|uniref:integrase n=1 Tax=Bradyrhizobium jicamae TaxID=280332 RepID=UPI001BAB060B|nr:integrase [Bradyrhizobium jicamae]MBR0937422.1 integrase [Bradyrhizobium jicamae]
MDHQDARLATPGLKRRKRKTGPPVPYWFATDEAIAAGYTVRSANLREIADDPVALAKRCQRLQAEMLTFLSGRDLDPVGAFDGTFGAALKHYETDSESPYNTEIKPGVRRVYGIYLKRLHGHIGALRIDHHDGRHAKRWFAEWRKDEDGSDHLPRALMVLAVLKAAISFGVLCRLAGCKAFQDVLAELETPKPKARTSAPSAEQITAVRKAAHAAGRPRLALLYALVYETTGRTFDFLGEWFALDYQKPSAVIARGQKWIGPMWSAIDANGIMTIKPTKTEDTSEVEVVFDLTCCPMVMEELTMVPEDERSGPLIIDTRTKVPFPYTTFRYYWREDFAAAELPESIWCRDLRAGGSTEGRKFGASKDDLRMVMGHTNERQTDNYDRAKLEAFRRVMSARTAGRNAS